MSPRVRDASGSAEASLADLLGLLVDEWSLLVIQRLLLGDRRYRDLHAHLPISHAVLTSRLRRLEESGVLTHTDHDYAVTPAGAGLWPVLLAMWDWERRWGADGASLPVPRHTDCGAELRPNACCAHCGEPVVFGEVDVEWGDAGGWAVSLPGARRRPHARVSPSGSRVWFTPEVFAVVGNRWSLAVVIGALWGMRRFRDFHIGLAIPPAVLTDRLHLLTEAGILATTPSSARADWWDYRPTPRAQELALFFLLALGWAARWWPHTREVLTVTHRRCAAPLRLLLTCAACGATVTGASVRVDSTIIPLPHHSAAASASPTPGES